MLLAAKVAAFDHVGPISLEKKAALIRTSLSAHFFSETRWSFKACYMDLVP